MKKLFIAILAVAGLAACSQDMTLETPKGAAIAFDNAFVNNSTRIATDITVDNLQDFGVYGSVVNNQGQQGLIFNNQEVEKSGNAYSYSPAQYWIADAQYDFVAIAPYQENGDDKTPTWTYVPTVNTVAQTGTLTFYNYRAAAEQDLLFASETAVETPASITSAPDAVSFTFNHLLSRVLFTFKNTFTDGKITLKVYDVKITNTAASGSVAVANGVVGEWEGTNDYIRAFGPATADTVAEIANNGTLTTEYFYLIPVQREYKVSFKVDIYQAGVKLDTYTHNITTTINLEKGKSYSLSANLAPNNVNPNSQLYPIEFQVNKITDWTTATQDIVSNN